MGILTWLVLGGLSGWLASIVTGKNARLGLFANIVIGILGAVLGGWIFSFFGGYGVTGFNLYSLFVSVVGSVVLITIVQVLI